MNNWCIVSRKPVSGQVWEQALPLGNGSLGGMVFGTVEKELIQLNQESVWSSGPRRRINPDAANSLDHVRELVFSGNLSEAEEEIYTNMLCGPVELGNYEPLADVKLVFDKKIPHFSELFDPKPVVCRNYIRKLDLRQALFTCSYDRDSIHYEREAFISYPDQVMVYRIRSSAPVGLRIELSRGNCCERILATEERITLQGRGGGDGPHFVADLLAVSNGKQKRTGFYLDIADATEITVYITGRTDFYGEDPFLWCEQRLYSAKEKGFSLLKERHLEDYTRLFDRVWLEINPDPGSGMDERIYTFAEAEDCMPDTDLRLQMYKENPADDGLPVLYFNYGRYLAIASSRPGSLPSNLQGLWNRDFKPQWGSRYTTNINLQMNYWPVEASDLPECHQPLFDHMLRMLPDGCRIAKEMYGCRGAVAHHNTDIYGDCAPNESWMPASIWPMGFAWLSTHIAEHFRFTRDLDFARKYYVVLAQASLFFADYLTKDEDGFLVTCPSTSPENTYILENGEKSTICCGPTMDIQIIRDLWTGFLEITEVLTGEHLLGGEDRIGKEIKDRAERMPDDGIAIKDLVAEIREKMQYLPPMQIGSHGQLLEWRKEYQEFEKGHRHISHLYGLYPADQISRIRTPELAAAAEKTIRERLRYGGGQTGWSLGWIINMWARLGNGEEAFKNLQHLLQNQTAENLFDLHPAIRPGMPVVFQIDGNFGGTAGIMEMLLQSQEGFLNFLPALPEKWKNGIVKGLKTRGNITVDMEWRDSRVTRIVLCSPTEQSVRLYVNGAWKTVDIHDKVEISGS